MFRSSLVAGIELALPLIEQCERGSGIADLIAEIIGNSAISVDIEKVLAQAARKEPAGHGKVFVMGASEAGTVLACLANRWRAPGDGVSRGQAAPAEGSGTRKPRVFGHDCGHPRFHSRSQRSSSARTPGEIRDGLTQIETGGGIFDCVGRFAPFIARPRSRRT